MGVTFTRGGRLYGYNEITEASGKKIGQDTVQCAHCNNTIFLDPKTPSPWCSVCDQEHCFDPGCFKCIPFMRKVEAAEAACRAKIMLWRAADNV